MKSNLLFIVLISSLVIISGCGRKTASDETTAPESVEIDQPEINDATLITPEEPFKNQPNEFCTVIRKLDISYYAPNKEVEDVTAYPSKYCLLDVCLEKINPNGMIINLGDENEVVTTSFELIKVFETEAEAKGYAERYKIIDVKW
ncbi:MAG: hypothetical protein IPO24_18820 [Bacteroidetes bacterium]|nr:hypothetical protein [Bacteroidota bacterium]